MRNAELLAKIKAEIERQIALLPTVGYSTQIAGDYIPVHNTLNYLLSFLDTLESEKPSDGLEEEIDRYFEPLLPVDIQEEPFTQMDKCARHFAQWGAEHAKDNKEED